MNYRNKNIRLSTGKRYFQFMERKIWQGLIYLIKNQFFESFLQNLY